MRPGEKLHEKLYDQNSIQETENKFILNENKVLTQDTIDIKKFLEEIKIFHQNKEIFKEKLLKFINF